MPDLQETKTPLLLTNGAFSFINSLGDNWKRLPRVGERFYAHPPCFCPFGSNDSRKKSWSWSKPVIFSAEKQQSFENKAARTTQINYY